MLKRHQNKVHIKKQIFIFTFVQYLKVSFKLTLDDSKGHLNVKILKMSVNKYPILAISRTCKRYQLVIRMVLQYYALVIKVASNKSTAVIQ